MTSTIKKSLAYVKVAPVVISVTRDVQAPAEVAWDVIADTPSWPEWFPRMSKAEYTSSKPPGIGATRQVKVGPLVVDEEFIAWERPTVWGFTFLETNVPFARAGVELAEIESLGAARSRITYTMAVDLRGPMFFRRIFKPLTKRSLGNALESFARYAEQRHAG